MAAAFALSGVAVAFFDARLVCLGSDGACFPELLDFFVFWYSRGIMTVNLAGIWHCGSAPVASAVSPNHKKSEGKGTVSKQ